MPEKELPSHEELRKIHEVAPSPEPPSHKPNRPNYEELKSTQPAIAREAEQVHFTDVIEAEVAAYQKDLDARVEAGRITPHERTYLMARYDELQAHSLKSPDAGTMRDVPEPKNDNIQQLPRRPDWKLMTIDKTYQQNVQRQIDANRAAFLRQMKMEKDKQPQRSDTGGRK